MERYRQTKVIGWAAAFALLLLLVAACSKEGTDVPEVPEVKYAKLTISLGSLDSAEPGVTKAGEIWGDNDILVDPDSADSNYEHYIKDWWIVVLDTENKVVNVISNTPNAINTHEDSETPVDIELEIGKSYQFYAFANLKDLAEGTNSYIQSLKKGDSFEKDKVVSLEELNNYTGEANTAYIPMSSYKTPNQPIEIKETNKALEIILIRMLGKVEVEVTNSTGFPVTIEGMRMGNFRKKGNIYLLPYDEACNIAGQNLLVGKGETKLLNPLFPEDTNAESSEWSKTLTTDNQLTTDDEGKTRTYNFYINETGQDSQENGTDMTFAIKVKGTEQDAEIAKNDEPQPTGFSFIRRNDLLKIPVLISHAELVVEAKQMHMPIGGLPATYKFESGVINANKEIATNHAGDITISYNLTELNGSKDGWSLKYYDETHTSNEQFCYAMVTDNKNSLLLKPEETAKLPWIGSDKEGYVLNHTEADKTSGSFTITTQELSAESTATVKLCIVATNGTQEVVLPYTLTITNKETTTNEEGKE